MQTHGLLLPTPEGKAVWTCEISADSGWMPGCPLTLLRLPPARVWTADRPAPFAGKVTPVAVTATVPEPTATTADSISTPLLATASDSLVDLTFSLFAPEEENRASTPNPPEPTGCVDETPLPVILPEPQKIVVVPPPATVRKPISAPEPDEPEQPASVHTTPGTGEKFIDWLKQGIETRKIIVNDTKAPVHLVQGKVLLVSPGIFKLYVAMSTGNTESREWIKIQKAFQKQGLHQRGDDGINIFACEVRGPRRPRQVKGYLLEKPELIFGNRVPEDNPYLSVISHL